MNAIKDIYRCGNGPSSSHTIAPKRAATYFKEAYPTADSFSVKLEGSLALTGKGHRTDFILKEVLGEKTEIIFDRDLGHNRNLMEFKAYRNNREIAVWHAESLGGGSLRIAEFTTGDEKEVYAENSFEAIKAVLQRDKLTLLAYILQHEKNLLNELVIPLQMMLKAVERGLNSEGLLNSELKVYRTAKALYAQAKAQNNERLEKMAYAYAAAEENAAGHLVVTAPTLGSSGIIAALMYYYAHDRHYPPEKLVESLAIGGLFANLIKKNATLSGAIGGCQAEIGSACAMAAAMIAYLNDAKLEVIEYAAEIGIEHHLGLTCDPVHGLVIIPCIERNAVAILRSFDAYELSVNLLSFKSHLVTFDMVVRSMNYTGRKISKELRETSLGGLALEFKDD